MITDPHKSSVLEARFSRGKSILFFCLHLAATVQVGFLVLVLSFSPEREGAVNVFLALLVFALLWLVSTAWFYVRNLFDTDVQICLNDKGLYYKNWDAVVAWETIQSITVRQPYNIFNNDLKIDFAESVSLQKTSRLIFLRSKRLVSKSAFITLNGLSIPELVLLAAIDERIDYERT